MELYYKGSGKISYSEKEYECDLYWNKDEGGILLNIISKSRETGTFFKFPLEIPFLIGELSSGLKFTLLNLKRKGVHDYFSDGYTEFSFYADYTLYGVANSKSNEQTFHKIRFTLSNIVNWGGISIYELGENSTLINKTSETTKIILKNNIYTVTYSVTGSMLPMLEHDLLKENISLEQRGSIEVIFQEEQIFETFLKVFEKIKHLIEIAMIKKINVEKVIAHSSQVLYSINDFKIEEPIEIYGKNIKKEKNLEVSTIERYKWISLTDLINNISFENYFKKYKKLSPILELFLEIFYTPFNSHTRIFLNIIQALETYHSRFIASNMTEFKKRICLLKEKGIIDSEETNRFLMANSKKFITLESRLADLLFAERNIFFDTGKLDHTEFPSIIARSRNYYIHYDEEIKGKNKVLSEEELQFYNRSLLKILEYYILLELGFPLNNINITEKLSRRWGDVSQDIEVYNLLKPQTP